LELDRRGRDGELEIGGRGGLGLGRGDPEAGEDWGRGVKGRELNRG